MEPGVAQRGREHVELEHLALGVGHAQRLLPVELHLLAGRRLEAGVGLGALRRAPALDAVAAHPLGERVVGRRLLAGVAAVDQVLVDAALGRAGQLRLGLYDLPVAVQPARAAPARVLHLAAGLPVLGHRVPVHAVAPGDVGEVGRGARLPVHVELSHDVPFQSGLLPSGDVGSLHLAAPGAPPAKVR